MTFNFDLKVKIVFFSSKLMSGLCLSMLAFDILHVDRSCEGQMCHVKWTMACAFDYLSQCQIPCFSVTKSCLVCNLFVFQFGLLIVGMWEDDV